MIVTRRLGKIDTNGDKCRTIVIRFEMGGEDTIRDRVRRQVSRSEGEESSINDISELTSAN